MTTYLSKSLNVQIISGMITMQTLPLTESHKLQHVHKNTSNELAEFMVAFCAKTKEKCSLTAYNTVLSLGYNNVGDMTRYFVQKLGVTWLKIFKQTIH